MGEPFKVTIKNNYGGKAGRKYCLFSKITQVTEEKAPFDLRNVHQVAAHMTHPFSTSNKTTVAYTENCFAFIGRIVRSGRKGAIQTERVELEGSCAVSLGESGNTGTCLIARVGKDGTLGIEKAPQHKSPAGSFSIDCVSDIKSPTNVVVGLARDFQGSARNDDDPLPAAAIEYKYKVTYAITPSEAVYILRRDGEAGDILRDVDDLEPLEVLFEGDQRKVTLEENNVGKFQDRFGNPFSDRPNSVPVSNWRPTPRSGTKTATPSAMPHRSEFGESEVPEQDEDDTPSGPSEAAKRAGFTSTEQFHAFNFLSRFNRTELQSHYETQKLKDIAKKTDGWFKLIREVDELDVEVLESLLILALYDCVLLLDDSSSMRTEEDGRRIPQMRKICKRIIDVDTIFPETAGVRVEFLNRESGIDVRTPAQFQERFTRVNFSGYTNLGKELRAKILNPRIYNAKPGEKRKPLLISIITDGNPYPEPRDQLKRELLECKKHLRENPALGSKTVVFQISQVGNDKHADAFISALRKDAILDDILDCTSYKDLDPPKDYVPMIEKHAPAVRLLAGALLANFEEYRPEDWEEFVAA